VDEAEKYDVIVGIEGGVNHPIYSPKLMKNLLDHVNSPNLQVIFDPVNYLTIDNYQNQDEIIHEAFELFGERIVIVHAKDFVVQGKELQTVPVGKGLLNYDTVMKRIKSKNPLVPILMEETKEPYINEGMDYLKQKYLQA
jgi:sugar phosphate isomerase/epimerase